MSDVIQFLKSKKVASKKSSLQTHTVFFTGSKPICITLSPEDVSDLRIKLYDLVGNGDIPRTWNAITEKVPSDKVMRMFADIDMKADLLTKSTWKSDMQYLVEKYHEMVESITKTSQKMFVASRMFYKFHLYFPDLVVDSSTAKAINEKFADVMKNDDTLKFYYRKEVVDNSVYSTGLRMLWNHKGGMIKKDKLENEIQEHSNVPAGGDYEYSYCIVDMTTCQKVDFKLDHLEECSIIPSDEQTVNFQMDLTTQLTRKNVKDNNIVSKVSVESIELPVTREFLSTQYGIQTCNVKFFAETKTATLSTSDRQHCPFKNGRHKSNNIYLGINSEKIYQRCHDDGCKSLEKMLCKLDDLPANVLEEINEKVFKCTFVDKIKNLQIAMIPLQSKFPNNKFDINDIWVNMYGAKLILNDLYCIKCEKEHEDPQTFLQCNVSGESFLECIKTIRSPPFPFPLSSEITDILFKGIFNVNFNITNNYNGVDITKRDFVSYDTFPKVYEDDERLNRILYESFTCHSLPIAMFVFELLKEKFLFENNQWYEYDGKFWIKTRVIEVAIYTICKPVYDKVKSFLSKEAHLKIVDNIIAVISDYMKQKGTLKNLEHLMECHYKDIKLDSNKHLIGFMNGIYDSDTLEFREHAPTDYVSKFLNYELPLQSDPIIREDIVHFFEEIIPNHDTREFLILYLSLHLEGWNRHSLATILTGTGGNGKSLMKTLMRYTFQYFHVEPSSTFLTSERPSEERAAPNIVDLKNKRCVFASEPEASKKINGGFIKFLTGHDVVRCRGLYHNELVEFLPMFIPTVLCNQIPLIDCGNDDVRALWRRIKIVHFPIEFVDDPIHPNQKKIDTNLCFRMKKWGPEMMLMLKEVYERYVKNGRNLHVPESVMQHVNEQEEENNPFKRFLVECLVSRPEHRVHVHKICESYTSWFREEFGKDIFISPFKMSKQLSASRCAVSTEKFLSNDCSCGNQARCLIGFDLKET